MKTKGVQTEPLVHRGLERVEQDQARPLVCFPLSFLLLSKIHWVFVAPAEVTGTGWDEPVRGLEQRDVERENGQQV